MLTATTNENVDKTKESPIGSAFGLFSKKPDETLTPENAITIINMSDGLPTAQQENMYDDVYAQLDDKEKVEFVRLLKDRDDRLSENFLYKLAAGAETGRKVLKELRKWPKQKYYEDYPFHVHWAREREKLGYWREWSLNKQQRTSRRKIVAGTVAGAGVGTGAGFMTGGPIGAGVGFIVGSVGGFIASLIKFDSQN